MKAPYYQDDLVTLYHGDCRAVLPILALQPALVVADPPYGIWERTARRSNGRGGGRIAWPSRDWPAIVGDDQPFDPSWLLSFRIVLWGANHYANRLPLSPSWLIWDKRDGSTSDDNADAELAWSNLGGPARIYRHCWRGVARASESGQSPLHPTQKPVALMEWLIAWRTKVGDLVVDPYVGSGPVLVAAKNLGRRAIGIEIEERYCKVTARRLSQEVLPL